MQFVCVVVRFYFYVNIVVLRVVGCKDLFRIKKVTLHQLQMTLNKPFSTSFGTVKDKDFFLIEVEDMDGVRGYGESVAFTIPWYTEETTETVRHVIRQFLIPFLRDKKFSHPNEISQLFQPIKRNNMAKAAIEGAIWDLYAKREQKSLSEALDGNRSKVDVGISLGMQNNITDLLKTIEQSLLSGYKRVKVKVGRERDVQVLREIRGNFPNLPLMVDANSAYTLEDVDHLRRFDEFNLMMIEQPLADDDILEHATLQGTLATPICLDESIHSLTDAKLAVELGSCRIINIKSGRVGGLANAKKIHDYCAENDIDVWVGGMLDAGVGRAQNIALASLGYFSIPGDIGPSKHYWKNDIIVQEVEVNDGTIDVSEQPGIGYDIDWNAVRTYRVGKESTILT